MQSVPGLSSKGWQVVVVNYENGSDLRFKLAGVDTVLSTVCGSAQLKLIEAAAAARVRRFVPSEFSGPPARRPADDLLDRGHRRAVTLLAQLESTGMHFCVFTCGILYDWFGPGGLAHSQLALQSGIGSEGAYLMNYRQRVARLPPSTASGQPAKVSMISLRDLAHCVVAALQLPSWPREFRVRGDRLNVREIVATAEYVQGMFAALSSPDLYADQEGRKFHIERYTQAALLEAGAFARTTRDSARELQLHHLVATAEGRFDFAYATLNDRINVATERFQAYLSRVWADAF
jgi:hypothetical protein